MMNTDFPYLCFLSILQKGRQRLIDDVLKGNPDLYMALYKDRNSEIYRVYINLYELQWIKNHWEELLRVLEQKNLSRSDKKRLIAIFAEWYKAFIKKWNYKEFEGAFFNEKLQLLQNLIVTNSEWETNLKLVRVSFDKSKKILDEKKKELEGKL